VRLLGPHQPVAIDIIKQFSTKEAVASGRPQEEITAMNFRKLIVLMTIALGLVAASAMASQKSLEHFFKKPEFAGFQLSPDGTKLAALAPLGDSSRMNIVVIDLATRKASAVTTIDNQDVSGFLWANNERFLFFMDKDGNESFGIFAVDIDGRKQRTLVAPLDAQVASGARSKILVASVMDVLKDDPNNVLVSYNKRFASYPDVYKMNIYSGKMRRVEANPGNLTGWFVDWEGNVIGAGFIEKNVDEKKDGLYGGFKMRDKESGEWVEVTRTRFDEATFTPSGIKGDGVNGWVTSNLSPDGKVRDKTALYQYNFATKQMGELVYEHDVVDCCGVMMSEKTRDMIGVSYAVGKPEMVWLDERWKDIMAGIDQALPDTLNRITSVDDDEKTGVVTSSSSIQPPRYYLYDFENRTLEYLADSRSWINAEEMAELKPISFAARDGMTMHGYLTLPPGQEAKNLPLIMNPHGGPWARDGWGFNTEHQFLASRGYAVLQVNFRGSTGFGMDHLKSSWKQWGQAMQNDISDAVKWAVDQGIADPGRVCIYGASYGGYATMAGLTFTPELYKCGINYVGVTDIALLFETAPDSWSAGEGPLRVQVGDPDTEKEFLEQWSPTNHADKMQAPVFMAYGRRDPRVNIKHLTEMEKAMDKHGVEYVTMIKTDEGHGFRKQENQYEFYGAMEKFLAEHLNP
jgi:dipeptidyl aminopeptidase/acylaminoacyl peptidase